MTVSDEITSIAAAGVIAGSQCDAKAGLCSERNRALASATFSGAVMTGLAEASPGQGVAPSPFARRMPLFVRRALALLFGKPEGA
jgi:hypothetical protein